MAKLHELIAVVGNRKGQSETARKDLANTFEKKRNHFTEKLVTFKSVDEGVPESTEEQLALQTTVRRELEWLKGILKDSFDVAFQIEVANTEAKADIVLENGTTLASNVPATALLELEKRVVEIQALVQAIPTLDPSKGFQPDSNRGDDVFVARDVHTVRTRKVAKPIILAPATDKHPAQVQLLSVDEKAGDLLTQEWSGLITVTEKGLMIERVEQLQRAVKQARSRANEAVVDTNRKIGNTLLSYVFGR